MVASEAEPAGNGNASFVDAANNLRYIVGQEAPFFRHIKERQSVLRGNEDVVQLARVELIDKV